MSQPIKYRCPLREALAHADWWDHGGPQTEMTTTEAFRILAHEIRRLREQLEGTHEDDV